jgi:hypothetical protein
MQFIEEKMMLVRRIFLISLAIIITVSLPPQTFAAGKERVKLLRQWTGSVADLALRKAVPEVICTEEGLENLWKAWKVAGSVPKVDFSQELVAIQTTQGSKLRLAATLDGKGNLAVLGLATRDLRPGFRYVVAVLSRKGVKAFNGKELPGEAAKSSLEKGSAQDREDFGVSDIEVKSVKSLDSSKLNAEVSRTAGKGETWTRDAVLVALKFIGAGLKGQRKIIDVRTPPENQDTATITITETGYSDDAIGGERWRLWLQKNPNGTWTIQRALWAQLCNRPGYRFYSAERCP